MNIPPCRDFFTLDDSFPKDLSRYALEFGQTRWLPGWDSTGHYVVEVRTLDFKSLNYRDGEPGPGWRQCTAIPEECREEYRNLLYSLPGISLVTQGAEYNVPVTGEKIYPKESS